MNDTLLYVIKVVLITIMLYCLTISAIAYYFACKERFANQQFIKLVTFVTSLNITTKTSDGEIERAVKQKDPQQKQPL